MKQSLIIVYITLVLLIAAAFLAGGSHLVAEGLTLSIKSAGRSAIMLIASFVITGQLNVLLTPDVLEKWLKRFSGLKAIVVSAAAGGLFPGGPFIYYPFIYSFKDKNLPFYVFISFLFGKQGYDFARLPMEITLVSWDLTLIRYLITLPIPILAGLWAKRFFGDKETYMLIMKAGDKDDSNNDHS